MNEKDPEGLDETANEASQSFSPSLASLRVRGGLGKTLLLAFLLLAIVPLSFLAFLTYHQVQRDIQERHLDTLETVVSLQAAHLLDWAEAKHRDLQLVSAALDRVLVAAEGPVGLAPSDGSPAQGPLEVELEEQLSALKPDYIALALVDPLSGRVLATTDAEDTVWDGAEDQREGSVDPRLLLEGGLMVTPVPADTVSQAGISTPVEAAVRAPWDGKLLVGLLSWEALREVVASPGLAVEDLRLHLVTSGGAILPVHASRPAVLPAVVAPQYAASGEAERGGGEELTLQSLLQEQTGAGMYRDLQGVPVLGAYRWLPELELGILVEQPLELVLAGADAQTALIVGATLAVALLTAALAAVITRRITRPIVQLTATASWMARGDLSRRVAVARRDEIGLLAGAFNRMAGELQILYANLEARVAERTAQLAEANEQAQHHARQLAISAEVARVASSFRDLPALLSTVVELIGRSFELEAVSLYLLSDSVLPLALAESGRSFERAPSAAPLLWQAGPGGQLTHQGTVAPFVPALVQAAWGPATGGVTVGADPSDEPGRRLGDSSAPLQEQPEMAIPLQVCGRTLGVLHLEGSNSNFRARDPVILRSLGDQMAIAIENASAYSLEHETVRRLRELDRIQSRFLSNMSHALRTPLNSIIGFSRVMLKGLDGSLNDLQRSDLATIHEGGRQLLGLIDDLLELSQWDIAPFDADQALPLGADQEPALGVPEVGVLTESGVLSDSAVDLIEVVDGVMATARALARDKAIQLYAAVPEDLPSINTDARLVRRLVLALLANAVKFTSEGQIRLAVTCNSSSVTVSVGASGSVHTWLGQAQVGVAQPIVERLGGEIESDAPGVGSPDAQDGQQGHGVAFGFTLPVTRQEVTPISGHPGGQA